MTETKKTKNSNITTYFSMFSGIGGFELGISKATNNSWECIGHSEINKYANQIYDRHFRGVKNYGDATKIIPDELPNFDMLCGGFPCQAFSIAGKRKGFEDTRGTLFFDIARIAAVKKPKIIFLENVKGLLNHDKGNTFAKILSTLDELGYDVEWNVLNSKNFGVPQNRERVFIIGHLRGTGGRKVFSIGEGCKKIFNTMAKKPIIIGTTKSNTAKGTNSRSWVHDIKGIIGAVNSTEYKQPKQIMVQALRNFSRNGRLSHKDGYVGSIQTSGNEEGIWQGDRIRRLTPKECERLQGFPDDWTEYGKINDNQWERISDAQRYKCLGNAVTVNVIEYVARLIK